MQSLFTDTESSTDSGLGSLDEDDDESDWSDEYDNQNSDNDDNNYREYSDDEDSYHSTSDDEDEEINDDEMTSKGKRRIINTIDNIFIDNNLLFDYQKIGIGKTYISGASAYPPELNENITIGAVNNENHITNLYNDGKLLCNLKNEYKFRNIKCLENIKEFISDSNVNIIINDKKEIGLICGTTQIKSLNNKLKHVVTSKNVIEIKDTTRKWYIHAKVATEDGSIIKIKLFADPGANAACVKTSWAIKHFKSFIEPNTKTNTLYTPGGPITPKYVLNLTFPTKAGPLLKGRMYLVNDLPVNILADINMLEEFGYVFKDGTPEIFSNNSNDNYVNMELKDDYEVEEKSSFNEFEKEKHNYNINNIDYDDESKPMSYDKIYGGDKLLYDKNNSNKKRIKYKYNGFIDNHNIFIHGNKGKITKTNINKNNIKLLPKQDGELICNTINKINNYYGNKPIGNSPIWNYCCFITAKQSYLASREEILEAFKLNQNLKLEWNTFEYLKEYPKKYGKRFNGLYDAVTKCVKENQDVFARYTFDRKTMKVKSTRLNIEPQHRDKIMYAPPYPINKDKRLSMINYTLYNEDNGFWEPIQVSLHSIPYTMVPKKKNGVVYRYRPAFDGRVVNQYCALMQSNMPTLRDFRELQSIRGFSTMADIKNCFDCIPLHPLDRKYAVAMTPLGLYRMNCQTYGWMNAAPNAQNITNRLCLNIGLAIAYIDDICIKHRFEDSVEEIIYKLNKLFNYCRIKNIQLDPSKFYPVTDKSEGFSFSWELFGKRISNDYKKKILAIEQPRTWKQMEHYLGVIGYVRNHIYNCSKLTYWLNELRHHCGVKGKINWTAQAQLAYKQLTFMVIKSPLLRHPTRDGLFCIQTDACNYGVGAVLLQKQTLLKEKKKKWVIVDLWSRTVPVALRNCHSMVHEAYAIVGACEYWRFELMKRKFIISTDNTPIANMFNKKKWYRLSSITQKQLLRLRMIIDIFDYDTYHIEGVENKLADSLSRYTSKLISLDETHTLIRGLKNNVSKKRIIKRR